MNKPGSLLKPLDQALDELLGQAQVLEGLEEISTFDGDGRVLAAEVVSSLQVPPQDNSSMDGYALRSADVPVAGTILQVTQRIPAGQHGQLLLPGEAARIFTGAPLPPGADSIVMQEACEPLDQGARVRVNVVASTGQWVRRAGEDVTKGAVILAAGSRLSPAELGLAASIGLPTLKVARQPRVALFSTGDELVMPGDIAPEHMPAGSIYNSNRFFLRALLQRLGCQVSDFGIVPDQRAATQDALVRAAQQHDLILTSGGVSVGEEDHIKPAVMALGALDLWQIDIKPGKPFAYGRITRPLPQGPCHFIGLPGNPVSSFVTFLLLVRPFLLTLQGMRQVRPARTVMTANFDWPRADRRREFLRVRRNETGGLDLFPNQSSGVLTSAVWGDGLVDNPAGRTIVRGDQVEFISFAELLA